VGAESGLSALYEVTHHSSFASNVRLPHDERCPLTDVPGAGCAPVLIRARTAVNGGWTHCFVGLSTKQNR
jgi:hypothetical protein